MLLSHRYRLVYELFSLISTLVNVLSFYKILVMLSLRVTEQCPCGSDTLYGAGHCIEPSPPITNLLY